MDVNYTTINKRGRAHKGILINKYIIKKVEILIQHKIVLQEGLHEDT
jgi:hypothetical protein